LNKRLPVLEKETKANPKLGPVLECFKKARDLLDSGKPLWSQPSQEWLLLKELQLLTTKPIIYVFNMDEKNFNNTDYLKELASLISPVKSIFICAKLEAELNDLDEADRHELLSSYGQNESGLNKLVSAAYDLLGLQSYLTAGQKEVRAWTIRKDSTAPQAAGVIHGDFERGFIAAEVVSYKDLVDCGSLQSAKAAGKVRTEGKTYVVKADDVIEFRFNV
jgi:hypothetical protein